MIILNVKEKAKQYCSSVVFKPCMRNTWDLAEMQIFGLQPRPTESRAAGPSFWQF